MRLNFDKNGYVHFESPELIPFIKDIYQNLRDICCKIKSKHEHIIKATRDMLSHPEIINFGYFGFSASNDLQVKDIDKLMRRPKEAFVFLKLKLKGGQTVDKELFKLEWDEQRNAYAVKLNSIKQDIKMIKNEMSK